MPRYRTSLPVVIARSLVVATILSAAGVVTVAAATPSVPPEGGVSYAGGGTPWGAIIAAVVLAVALTALRWPRTRPWLASLAILVVTAFVSFWFVLLGSFTNFSSGGAVPLPYLLSAGATLLGGIALSVWVARRLHRRNRRAVP
jgi:hypothetical protein